MRGLATFPGLEVIGAADRNPVRRAAFARHWSVPTTEDVAALVASVPPDGLVLNLTNPADHAAVTRLALESDRHVWSEKPVTTDLADAVALADLARSRGLQLASAPSSVLSRTAQTLLAALRRGDGGAPRLAYADLDDGWIPQTPYATWVSESGAPWPYEDEVRTGCTLEHAGYWLAWLIAAWGPVARVQAAASTAIPDKGVAGAAPDTSVALLEFASGPVARVGCSIVAPHDHRLRIFTEGGVIEVPRAWDNAAPVNLRRRVRIRRRLMELPVGRRLPAPLGPSHPMVKRTGAASMNFGLGPAEMLGAIAAGRPSRLSGDYAVHLTEVTLAIQAGGTRTMTTTCAPMEPMTWPA